MPNNPSFISQQRLYDDEEDEGNNPQDHIIENDNWSESDKGNNLAEVPAQSEYDDSDWNYFGD